MFTAALFTIVKIWKQPKCQSTDKWVKMMWYIYTMGYYSAIKKNKILPFSATWMDLEMNILNKVRQRKTNIWYHLYMESKKNSTNELIYKTNRRTDIENKLMVMKGERGEGIN